MTGRYTSVLSLHVFPLPPNFKVAGSSHMVVQFWSFVLQLVALVLNPNIAIRGNGGDSFNPYGRWLPVIFFAKTGEKIR